MERTDGEAEKDHDRRKLSATTAGSDRRERNPRGPEIQERKRENEEREATITVYAYSATAARPSRQPVVQQRFQEETDSILTSIDGSRIRIRRKVSGKSR